MPAAGKKITRKKVQATQEGKPVTKKVPAKKKVARKKTVAKKAPAKKKAARKKTVAKKAPTKKKAASKKSSALVIADEANLSMIYGPRWRWDIAREYTSMKSVPSKDPLVINAWKYFKDYSAACNSLDVHARGSSILRYDKLKKKYPDMYVIHNFFNKTNILRYAAEALLIAGEDPDLIAQGAGLTRKQLDLYMYIFYDISFICKSKLLVMQFLIGKTGDVSFGSEDMDAQWKAIAYCGSSEIFRTYIETGSLDAEALKELDKIIDAQVRRKTLGAAFTLKASNFNATEIINMYTAIKNRVVAESGGADEAVSKMFSGLEKSLSVVSASKKQLSAVDGVDCYNESRVLPNSEEVDIIGGRLREHVTKELGV